MFRQFALLFCIIVLFICSCESMMHYYDQEDQLILGIDSYIMLKLLQDKKLMYRNANYEVYDINSPFKRILDKNSYYHDLQMAPRNDNNNSHYNNSFYQINDKYQKYFDDPMDDILIKALYSDLLGYNRDDFLKLQGLVRGDGGYGDTHVLLALLFLKSNKSYRKQDIQEFIDKIVLYMITAQMKEKKYSDLFAERVVFLYWAGSGGSVRNEWIEIIKGAQNPDLGWPYRPGLASDPHATGLSLLALLYYKEGKNHQKLY